MVEGDREQVLKMMQAFYSSPAVFTNGSKEIFERDIDNCIGDCPHLEGYVFQGSEIMGYAMLAKSFSTEFGKPCIWLEDIYIKEQYRGQSMGKSFLKLVAEKYPDAVLRLEAEEENVAAVSLYEKSGFGRLPYIEMFKN